MTLGKNKSSEEDVDAARIAAAILIQRIWRGRANKAKKDYMTTQTRWDDAANRARLQVSRRHAQLYSGVCESGSIPGEQVRCSERTE